MFSQLKNFLSKTLTRRSETPQPAQAPAAPTQPATAPAQKPPGGTAFQSKSKPAPHAPAPTVKPPTQTSTSIPTPPAAAASPAGPDEPLNLPLKVVLSRLPAALTALVKSPRDGDVAISTHKILKQLPLGAVKLTFGELRQAAPAGTFLEVTTQDQTLVELPLPEIVSRLNPSHFQRRTPSKQLDAPPEVANIFGPRGEPLPQPPSETTMFRKAGGGTSLTQKPIAPPQTTEPSFPAPAKSVAPTPLATPTISAPSLPKPSIPMPPEVTAPPPPKIPAPALPKPATPLPKVETPKIPMPSVPVPTPASAAAPQTQYFLEKETIPTTQVLTVALASISETWPENIRKEITEQKLGDASVALPMNKVEVALKTGKIAFTWNDIGSWIKPDALSNSPNGTTVLELPLKVVAPLFISQHRPLTAQKKLAVDENIPDIFAGNRAKPVLPSASTPAAAPLTPSTSPAAPINPSSLPKPPTPAIAPTPITPSGLPKPPPALTPLPPALPKMSPVPAVPISMPKQPTAAPAAPSLPKLPAPTPALPKPSPLPAMPIATPATPAVTPSAAKEPQTLGELFGDPSKKEWSPKEIVQKTNELKGVAGSMISLADGLMVAGELPAPFRAETTAAFLPQIFGRMNQYSKELHLGDMNGVSMECQKAPMRIIRTGMVFFGVLGRAGEPLPEAQIRLIAEELAKQNK